MNTEVILNKLLSEWRRRRDDYANYLPNEKFKIKIAELNECIEDLNKYFLK